jgi:hypothetical protein
MKIKVSRMITIIVGSLAFLFINTSSVFGVERPDTSTLEPVFPVSQPRGQVLGTNAPTTPLIQVLQIYPDGHNTTVVAQGIYSWSTMFHIDVFPVTTFNTCTSVTCTVTVLDPMTGATATHPINYYDILYFGVADDYGHYDLSTTSVSVVREFAQLGRGIVFTTQLQ